MPSELADKRISLPDPAMEAAPPCRFHWHFAPIAEGLNQAIRRVPWEGLAAWPAANRVKVAENRDVWRIEVANRTIYAKCYRSQGLVKTAVDAIRGPAARREWLALGQAAAIDVLAPPALAYATAQRAGTYSAILVTAAMPAGAQTLDEAWLGAQVTGDPQRSRRRKDCLMDALAELIARAHAGGLFHRDLHVGNILIFPHNGSVTAAMIDLHNARLRRGFASRHVLANLVQLNQWFSRHAGRTERLRFLKRYCEQVGRRISVSPSVADARGRARTEAPAGPCDYRQLARGVLAQADAYAARLHAKRDRRILKRNKYFTTLRLSGGWTARIALDIKHGRPYEHPLTALPDRQTWATILADPPALLSRADARVLKDSPSRRVVRADLPDGWTIIAKREPAASLRERILGRGGLLQEFVTGWRCLHRELPVALPLAILRRAGGGESILLVEHIPQSYDLDTFARLNLPDMDERQARHAKRRVIAELSRTLRRLWACGLAHRDLKAANIRVQLPDGDIERARIVLLDVDGIRRPRLYRRRALLRSLARLDASFAHNPRVTRTDRLRLLLAVLRETGHRIPDWRQAWRHVRALSLRDQTIIARQLPWLQSLPGAAAVP